MSVNFVFNNNLSSDVTLSVLSGTITQVVNGGQSFALPGVPLSLIQSVNIAFPDNSSAILQPSIPSNINTATYTLTQSVECVNNQLPSTYINESNYCLTVVYSNDSSFLPKTNNTLWYSLIVIIIAIILSIVASVFTK